MQIITMEDEEFDSLFSAWKEGKKVGRFWKGGTLKIVCATRNFMLVSNGRNPGKFAIKPVRSQLEAEDIAQQLLTKERKLGSEVIFHNNDK